MKEDMITLETAKLAKKKGFDLKVIEAFVDLTGFDGGEMHNNVYTYRQNHNSKNHRYSRPSQSLLKKWLREKHGLILVVRPTKRSSKRLKYMCGLYKTFTHDEVIDNDPYKKLLAEVSVSESYDDALEEGLLYALNKIK